MAEREAADSLPPPSRPWNWNSYSWQQSQPQPHYQEAIKRLDNAAVAAYRSSLADGVGVTVAAVLSRMLGQLGIYTLESIGVQMHHIPCLRTLSAIEGKVNAFVLAYVAGNRITTLHDLVLGLCEDERVESFDDLGLGPVVKHSLVQQLFGLGLVEVYKVTALDVLHDLNKLLEKKQHVDSAALLSFVAEERGVDVRKLGIRIQSLGMYIGISREVKRKERETLQRWEANMKKARDQREAIQRAIRETHSSIESQKPYQKPSHIRFSYSDSDSDENKAVPPRHSSCPFPSSREEQDKSLIEAAGSDFSLKISAVSKFVDAWKHCCYDLPVTEVLKRMLTQITSEKRLKKFLRFFKTRPALAVLNIAVASMKRRFCPSGEDADFRVQSTTPAVETAFKSLSEFDYELSSEAIIESVKAWGGTCRGGSVSQALNNILGGTKASRKAHYFRLYPAVQLLNIAISSISSGEWDGILKVAEPVSNEDDVVVAPEASCTFTGTSDEVISLVNEHFRQQVPTSQVKNVIKCLIDCEKLLISSFTDKVFSSLGFKSFLNYLELHLQKMTVVENKKTINIDTTPQHRIAAFVRQASHVGDGLSKQDIAELYCKQFSLAAAPDIEGFLIDNASQSSTVFFSAALLGNYLLDSKAKVGKLGSKTDADAEAWLAKSPMLTDLALWSQWSAVYEPQLGPLLDWLEQEGRNRQVLAVVTKRGRILRVDGQANPELFLDAVSAGRALEVAAQLVSLSVIYGGASKTPKELLQTHAVKGIQVYTDRTQSNTTRKRKQTDSRRAASFILDCLASVPGDFTEFAADVLYTAFKRVFADAAALLIQSCNSISHRMMLHRMGLAGGVSEWIKDYTTLDVASHADESYRDSLTGSEALHKRLKLDDTQQDTQERLNSQVFSRAVKDEVFEEAPNNEAREVVRMIRKEEFGLEEHEEAVQSGLLAKQHARMGRALECLSQNLYSEDCHFILELVQNADDNGYPPRANPTLAFVIQKDRIVVLNNEQGFTAKNIRALCDVGKSTKKGMPAGYIGHKGIGFKSVFRVTESPEIHSNGFHVKFDISESSIGFILPTWVHAPRDNAYFEKIITEVTAEQTGSMTTRIDLPLRAAVVEADSVSSMFQDLQPKLLLFLHKLQTLVVKNELSNSCWRMRRLDVGNNIIKLTDGTSTGTFLVVRQLLDAPMDRAGVPDTELALAFELKAADDAHYASLPVQQEVFAFLPVRTYGLKFVVQGDFILPSSREDLDRDSAWNQWLRSEVPKLFLQSLHCFQTSTVFGTHVQAISSYLSYVPIEGEVLGFFSSLPTMILSLLRAAPCMPAEGSAVWSRPCSTLRGWDIGFRQLVPDDMLKQYLGLVYLDKQVIISDVLASSLGVPEYGVSTLVELMQRVGQMLQHLGIGWLRRYLLEMHKCFAVERRKSQFHCQQEQRVAETLRSVPFIPLSSGGFTSLDDGPVWFLDAKGVQGHSTDFLELYSDIRTVSPFLINEDNVDGAGDIREMLVKLGIKVVSAHEVIKSHILPAMASPSCLEKDPSLVVQYLAYCGLHLEIDTCRSCEEEKEGFLCQLKDTAVVLTKEGLRTVADSTIHFGKELGNTVNVAKILGGLSLPWSEVDNKYLRFNPSVAFWRKFLSSFGICDFINVVPSRLRVEDKCSTVWKNEKWLSSNEKTAWIVQDWKCEDSIRICTALSRSEAASNSRLVLSTLDDMWDEHYEQFSRGSYSVEGAAADVENDECESSFILQLREYAWVESSLDGRLHKPTELFERSVESVLGSYGSYSKPQVKSKKLARALGLRNEVGVEDILDLLRLLSERQKQGRLFISISQMERIYAFLSEKLDKRELQRLFDGSPCILLPSSRGTRSNDDVAGTLYSSSQVIWNDPFGLDNSTEGTTTPMRTLCNAYSSGMREFFVAGCGVPELPDFPAYITVLQHIARTMAPSKILDKVLELFAFWSREFESGKLKPEAIRDAFTMSCDPTLPTTENTWTSLRNTDGIVCWCDDAELADKFDYLNSSVKFVDVGRSSSSILLFLKEIGVPRFSELVEKEAIIYGPRSSPELENIVRLVLPYGQRYLRQFHPENYAAWKENLDFQCVVVDTLFSRYKLKSAGLSSRHRIPCSCLLQDNKLYVSSSHIEDYASIFLELSRVFFSGKQQLPLANFFHLIALQARNLSDTSHLESLVTSSQGLLPLPAEEPAWKLRENQTEKPSTSVMASRADEFLERQRKKRETSRNFAESPANFDKVQKQKVVDLDDYSFSEQQVDERELDVSVDRESLVSSRPANREQQEVTGRSGEKLVYEHLCRKYGPDASVLWVNQDVETGCPYDITVDGPDGRRMFVEVKSTRSSSKDWFELSPGEWEFATTMREQYSIVRIQMLHNKRQLRLVMFSNPVQLCRDKVLQLAVLVPH